MIFVSCATVSDLPIGLRAGTSRDVPPLPWGPWQAEQANWTNRCAPMATRGSSTAARGEACALDPPPWLAEIASATAGTARPSRASRRIGAILSPAERERNRSATFRPLEVRAGPGVASDGDRT